jgi:hypothetical protein
MRFVAFWHFSTDRGTAASRQQLGPDRTSQTLLFDAIDPKRASADCRLKGMSARFKPAILSQLAWWTKALKARGNRNILLLRLEL